MLNPQILLRGDDEKHKYLLVEFEQFDRDNETEHAYDEYESFEQEKEQ